MVRIAVVTTSYPRTEDDSAGHFVQTEARALRARGHTVTVLAPGPGNGADGDVGVAFLPGGEAFGSPGALERLRRNPLRARDALRFVVEARRALLRLGPFDAVVAHWILPSAWPIARRVSAPLDVVVHGSDVRLVERLPRALRQRVVGSLLDRGATFRFVSRELERRLAEASTPRLLAASRVLPCAIDVSAAPPRPLARTRLGLGPDDRFAVVVGRLVASKAPGRAIELARAREPRVVVVGDGPLLDGLRRAHPGVEFRGRLGRRATLELIAASDLLVGASREEGAPTVIREARALGTPVLAVRCGDVAEWARADPGIRLVDD